MLIAQPSGEVALMDLAKACGGDVPLGTLQVLVKVEAQLVIPPPWSQVAAPTVVDQSGG
jgi:hypothetical protein